MNFRKWCILFNERKNNNKVPNNFLTFQPIKNQRQIEDKPHGYNLIIIPSLYFRFSSQKAGAVSFLELKGSNQSKAESPWHPLQLWQTKGLSTI